MISKPDNRQLSPSYADVMIDLESLGKTPDSVILTLGAAKFAAFHMGVGPTFHVTLEIAPQIEAGRIIDPETAAWWREPERLEMYQKMLDDPEKMHPHEGLIAFRDWLETDGVPANQWRVWGNGAAFDNVLLASLYRSMGLPVPWNFRNDRCYRTIKNLYPMFPVEQSARPHVAVDDAIAQVRTLNRIMDHWRRAESHFSQYTERKGKRKPIKEAGY